MTSEETKNSTPKKGLTRRDFIAAGLGGAALAAFGLYLWPQLSRPKWREQTFIGKAPDYRADITAVILSGFRELGISPAEIRGKRILLKPNLVETDLGAIHINTHPAVIYGAGQAFLKLGAAQVIVGEGPGHCRDTLMLLEESGLAAVLWADRIPFVDLNYETGYAIRNPGRYSSLTHLTFPETLRQVDWVVSLAKLKTHHWAGVTLSMKNLFGVMPGSYYGWPKNVLHHAGIEGSILDIVYALKPQLAIVDGIVGMEGDGPIMGTPKQAGVLVMGRNLPAVDATCARVMGIDPRRVEYLAKAEQFLGPIRETEIMQVGEAVAGVRSPFKLVDFIPAHRKLLPLI
ncbi:MAG: DUF362 domain-containing protein [Thermodesulfobacteriota bacterium]